MWALLRIWHVEVLASVADNPNAFMFARTSYCVAPAAWKQLSAEDVAVRAGILLDAAYATRNHQMAQTDDPTPTWLVAFEEEWVTPGDMPALSPANDAMIARDDVARALIGRAVAKIDALRGQPRPGIDAKAWQEAFSAWRVEADGDEWHLLDHTERNAVFGERLARARTPGI